MVPVLAGEWEDCPGQPTGFPSKGGTTNTGQTVAPAKSCEKSRCQWLTAARAGEAEGTRTPNHRIDSPVL